jgi:hypothetical protein
LSLKTTSTKEEVRVLRKVLVAVTAALALACALPLGASAVANGPGVICSNCNDGGHGWTGCTTATNEHAAGLPYLSWVRHYLVVSYCKRNGTITSISIAAHDCSVRGLAFCHPGAAWQTAGGVGYGWATFEAHATWGVTVVPIYNNADTLTLTVPVG